ncbi:MAG: hypothetical protein NT154_16645, partial [Verrucomicrobia bacterium]|nr:hypothetical protein [Verrucomicrobiota bacterium]
AQGPRADQMVTFALLEELCRVAHHIRGVHGVRLAYVRGQTVLKTVHPLTFRPATPDGQTPAPSARSGASDL